jgi:hypothetical protein
MVLLWDSKCRINLGAEYKMKGQEDKLGYNSWDEALDAFAERKKENKELTWDDFRGERKCKIVAAKYKKQIQENYLKRKEKEYNKAWEEFKKTQEWKNIVDTFKNIDDEDDEGEEWKKL